MKLMLGTVQFGLDYGLTNVSGQTSREEINKILNFSKSISLNFLDTSYGYGESEKALGESGEILSQFKVVTKLANLTVSGISVTDSLNHSLSNLKVESVYGLLFHNPDDLLSNKAHEYFGEILRLKNEKKVQKIGVSVYTVEQLEQILDKFNLDIVQIPLNIFDQRFLENNFLKKIKNRGIEIHIRSVFLQGLLLENPNSVNSFFKDIKKNLEHFNHTAQELKMKPIELLLAFANGIREVDQVIVGVNNLQHLQEIAQSFGKKTNLDFSQFKVKDEKYLLPTNWKLI